MAECITQILQENSHRFISTDVSLQKRHVTDHGMLKIASRRPQVAGATNVILADASHT